MAYTQKQKSTILARFDKERESGKTAHQAAEKAGASYLTILRWRKAAARAAGLPEPGQKRSSGPAQPGYEVPSRLTLLTPDGFKIEADHPKDIVPVLLALK